jgi:hypothetical protein
VKRASPIAARAAVHLLLWTALLAMMVGTHQSLRFCIGSCCQTAAVEATGCCQVADEACCCKAKAPRKAGQDQGGTLRPDWRCSAGCCIDVSLAFEHGPLPRRVVLDHGPEPMVALAPEPLPASVVLAGSECDPGAPATGPPRRDRRTLLLSSTILRL